MNRVRKAREPSGARASRPERLRTFGWVGNPNAPVPILPLHRDRRVLVECGDLSPLSRRDLSPSNCRRRVDGTARPRLAPAVARPRNRIGTEVRRRQVACAKAVTSHRTPKLSLRDDTETALCDSNEEQPAPAMAQEIPNAPVPMLPLRPGWSRSACAAPVTRCRHRAAAVAAVAWFAAASPAAGQPDCRAIGWRAEKKFARFALIRGVTNGSRPPHPLHT